MSCCSSGSWPRVGSSGGGPGMSGLCEEAADPPDLPHALAGARVLLLARETVEEVSLLEEESMVEGYCAGVRPISLRMAALACASSSCCGTCCCCSLSLCALPMGCSTAPFPSLASLREMDAGWAYGTHGMHGHPFTASPGNGVLAPACCSTCHALSHDGPTDTSLLSGC